MPLTNIEIKNAQPKDKEYVMSDGGGLVILVKPSGTKLWRYRYSINAKKQKLSLGSYPEISLAQARIRAANARAKVAQGISPVTERREKIEASKVINSFEGVCLEWRSANSIIKRLMAMQSFMCPVFAPRHLAISNTN
ncbi:DUF4102 domain-containing protein [Salmonella enterica]|nr:DUF4102 domain-containing protein [Salmonella enterica subsp. salamae]EDW2794606.1 DUF4102 domain-containing protein [Salmonella enterica]EDW4471747.1 DUF4102 domain-containing protein [Salmonella enterica subsp. salamae]EEA2273310.1 DUF4102 domain-containing protein [Salmonella enterica]EFV5115916.1 DUF4102 domain-containing protein [Salmonella enterica]